MTLRRYMYVRQVCFSVGVGYVVGCWFMRAWMVTVYVGHNGTTRDQPSEIWPKIRGENAQPQRGHSTQMADSLLGRCHSATSRTKCYQSVEFTHFIPVFN